MPGKHGPNRLSSYIEVHETVMMHLHRGGIVISDSLVFTPLRESILLEGRVHCLGGVTIDVRKVLSILERDGANSLVQTVHYSYNVSLEGFGNLFRYDSPHATHNRHHHVHRYQVPESDKDGSVEFIHDDEQIPTLGEVIGEAMDWYYRHFEDLSGKR